MTPDGALQLGVLLALVAVVVHGLVDVPYFKNDLCLLFWTLVALTVAGLFLGSKWRLGSTSRQDTLSGS